MCAAGRRTRSAGAGHVLGKLHCTRTADTGVDYSHPDLVDNLSESSYNAADGSADATDENGHGTLVAGTLGATGAVWGCPGWLAA